MARPPCRHLRAALPGPQSTKTRPPALLAGLLLSHQREAAELPVGGAQQPGKAGVTVVRLEHPPCFTEGPQNPREALVGLSLGKEGAKGL